MSEVRERTVSDDEFGTFDHPKKGRFLANLAELGTVQAAAQATGISRTCPYLWREQDEEFSKAMEEADEFYTQKLERTAYQNAETGNTTMQIFLLKSRREKYKDRVDLHHSGGGIIEYHSFLESEE